MLQDVEWTVQDVETKDNPITLNSFAYWGCLLITLIWNNMTSY